MVRFCDVDCQKAGWKEHKALCRAGKLTPQLLRVAESAAMLARMQLQP